MRDEVPTAETVLVGGDHITVVVGPQATAALDLLRRGTEHAFVTG